MHLRFYLLCLIAWLPLPALATAQIDASTQQLPLDGYISVLEDPGGKFSLSDVIARQDEFKRTNQNGRFSLGYSASHWWLRVDVATSPKAARHWRFHVGYPPLDSVEAWLPQGSGWANYRTGDRLPFASRPTQNVNFVFPLELEPGQTSTLYLRVASAGSLTVPLQIFSEPAYESATSTAYLLNSLYFGTLLALGIYNLLLFFSVRDRTYLLYVAFVIGMGLGVAGQTGIAAQFIWPDSP